MPSSKGIWAVQMPVIATTTVYVRAESLEEALENANHQHADESVTLCWQCSDTLEEPMIGEVSNEEASHKAWEVTEDDEEEFERATSFIKQSGYDE